MQFFLGALRIKRVVLLLLIQCFLLLPLIVGGGGGVWSLFCFAVLSVLASFEIISLRVIWLLVLFSLPHGAVGWSAVCEYGTFWSYSCNYSFIVLA